MITKCMISPVSTAGLKNTFIVYIQGEKKDVQEIINNFKEISQDPFEINQDDFNWAFYIINSTEQQRFRIKEAVVEKGAKFYEGKIDISGENDLRSLVEEVKKVIQDLDKKGLTLEELKSIEEKTSAKIKLEEEQRIKEGKKKKDLEKPEEEEIRIGYLFPEKEKSKFDIFIQTLSEIETLTSKKPITLNRIFLESYNPFDESLRLDSVIKLFKNNKIDTLVILTPDSRMVSKEKDIIEELKKRLKRKVLFKIVPLPKISKRSIYLDIIVDMALFKGKGIEYFNIKK